MSERSALAESRTLKDSLAPSSPRSARVTKHTYDSMGEYRPMMQQSEPEKIERSNSKRSMEFQRMLELVGSKVSQKFSKARDVFRFVDSDHSGTISRSECHYFFRFFNIVPEEADKFFEGFETDDEGEISYIEFLKYLWPHINPGNEQTPWRLAKANPEEDKAEEPVKIYQREEKADQVELPADLRRARVNIAQRLDLRYKTRRDAFRDLDTDKDGVVSREEVRTFFRLFGWETEADKFFDVLHERGNGEVSFRVFASLFDHSKDINAQRLRL